jgi:hypothetical protein
METAHEVARPPLESHLVACVQENLALYMYENAIFLGERLLAEFPSEANVYLLATCYHRAQQTYRAFHLLKGGPRRPPPASSPRRPGVGHAQPAMLLPLTRTRRVCHLCRLERPAEPVSVGAVLHAAG